MNNQTRATQLQFLRFCAFLLICIFHTGDFQFSWWPGDNGAANAVAFFIVLSGAVSGFSSYETEVECSVRKILQYMWKKIKKIYPLYFVTMMITIAYSDMPKFAAQLSYPGLKGEFKFLVRCVPMLQSWFPSGYFAYNGVGWFVSTIMFLYLINIPLRALAGRIVKAKKSDLYFAVFFGVTAVITVFYCYLTRNTKMEYTQYILPVSRVGEYICGMALGYLVYSRNKKLNSNGLKIKIVFTILEIAALSVWIWNMYLPMADWHYRIVHWLLPNCLLIVVFAFGRGYLSDLFRLNFLRYLGDISFECFLLHLIVIRTYTTECEIVDITSAARLFTALFCVSVTVMLAMLISKQKIKQKN